MYGSLFKTEHMEASQPYDINYNITWQKSLRSGLRTVFWIEMGYRRDKDKFSGTLDPKWHFVKKQKKTLDNNLESMERVTQCVYVCVCVL